MKNGYKILIGLLWVALGQSACAPEPQVDNQTSGDKGGETLEVKFETIEGQEYASIDDLAATLGMNVIWDEETKTLGIGANDASSEIAEKDIKEVNGKRYITREALNSFLLNESIQHQQNEQQIMLSSATTILPRSEEDIEQELAEPLGFALATGNDVIATAKKYMGVRYVFGAKPSSAPSQFDCSSFVQYVFKKYGISLRRTSRDQAKQGTYVARKNLRPGDLVFFRVPGRFKNPNTVGHVGIYIGNNQMINTLPNKGVHIRALTGHWSDVYITARRVITPGGSSSSANSGSNEQIVNGLKDVFRYFNGTDHYLTSRKSGPRFKGYTYEGIGFRVFVKDQGSSTRGIYSCWRPQFKDQFISNDPKCKGHTVFGIIGYLWKSHPSAAPVYRCLKGPNRIATTNVAECKLHGYKVEGILGYHP